MLDISLFTSAQGKKSKADAIEIQEVKINPESIMQTRNATS